MCESRQAPRGTMLIRRAHCRVWASGVARTSSSGRASQRLHALPSCSIDSAQVVGAVVTQVDTTFVGREHLEQLRTHTQRLSRWQMRWGIGSLHGGTQGK